MLPALTAGMLREQFSGLLDFIRNSWHDPVPHGTDDASHRIGSLQIPCAAPIQRERSGDLYYWDTFYANEGLLAHGHVKLARQNVDNMLRLVYRYGFLPNGSRRFLLTHSQPPHLALMVDRVFAYTGDLGWLESVITWLEMEHAFWQTNRLAPCGLNRYGHHAAEDELVASCETAITGPGHFEEVPARDEDKIRQSGYTYAAHESGWVCSPRFDHRASDFCPVDLNALLYATERIIARAHRLLGRENLGAVWETRAARRASLMRWFLWSHELGAFADYDYINRCRSMQVSAAMFYPVWLGVTNSHETFRTLELLPRLERAHGIVACEAGLQERNCQWDAPHAWPPLQYATVRALQTGGRHASARRVARAFLDNVSRNFAATNELWEKYNAETGEIQVQNEYHMPGMMGWTAGVCAALAEPSLG